MVKRVIPIGLVVAMLLLGCGPFKRGNRISTPPVGAGKQMEPLAADLPAIQWRGTQFEDVPIPPDFTLDYDASYMNVSGEGWRARVADLRYTGEGLLTEALSNVQQGMHRSGWRLTSLTGVAIKSLRFIKGEEECQVIIREGDEGETVLVVRLHPRL